MARLVKSSPLQGLSGVIGKDLMFRQVNGETIVSFNSGAKRRKSSERQKLNRGKFREASRYAKAQMRIPERKEHNQRIAKKLKLPNAYTAAVTEFMRKPKIEEVKVEKLKGGRMKVKVKAYKKGFELEEVRVIARNGAGEEAVHKAKQVGNCFWEVELGEGWDLREVVGEGKVEESGKWGFKR